MNNAFCLNSNQKLKNKDCTTRIFIFSTLLKSSAFCLNSNQKLKNQDCTTRIFIFSTTLLKSSALSSGFQLNDYEIRSGKKLGVTISYNNHRLFIGNIPKNRDKDELAEELGKHARKSVCVCVIVCLCLAVPLQIKIENSN